MIGWLYAYIRSRIAVENDGFYIDVKQLARLAFGDVRATYLINDRIGIRILRDPFTNKPFVNFYCTKRVGGGLLDPNAVRLLRIPV